jgi:23S rRNA (cytosine1962-C5)-methyltransferase/23S rRNA (guanine2445-N2)-methyltransferase / 23S rRNA (guanine2069-N7)-methyltransferase
MDMIKNRLKKNYQHKKSKATNEQTECFRLYDKDIPEYPYIIDLYKDRFLVVEKGLAEHKVETSHRLKHKEDITQALKELFQTPDHFLFFKERKKFQRSEQYEKKIPLSPAVLNFQEETYSRFIVREKNLKFWVDLEQYIDTGLFLDHRPLRHKLSSWIPNQRPAYFLNLFCYTGSFSVQAAMMGMKTMNIDLSKTYLRWAEENFLLNNLPVEEHLFIHGDVLEFIEECPQEWVEKISMIYVDPPIFSRSKRMEHLFETQKDHLSLLKKIKKFLSPEGILIFSTPQQRFQLAKEVYLDYQVRDITPETIPWDFRQNFPHHTFLLRKHL